jgi:hypothetical protein
MAILIAAAELIDVEACACSAVGGGTRLRSVPVVVTVQFKVDPERMLDFVRVHPDVYEAILEAGRRNGLRSHRQLHGDGEVMDIDEWGDLEGRQAFLRETAPDLERMAAFLGGSWESKVWTVAEDTSR